MRAIIPGKFKEEQYLLPLESAFSKYSKERYEIIVGAATASDFSANSVTVVPESGPARTLQCMYKETRFQPYLARS